MLAELRKHAATSRALHRLALEKDAALLGSVMKAGLGAAKRVAAPILVHPAGSLTIGLGGAAAIGQGRRTAAQFNPAVHRAQLGIQP